MNHGVNSTPGGREKLRAACGARGQYLRSKWCAPGTPPPFPRSVAVYPVNQGGIMKSSTQDRVEGTAKEAKGVAKQEWGKATHDTGKRIEGTLDRAEGKIQRKTGEMKRDKLRE
jgi:uncharacterized protein YjbJ (UPF0337 family)